MKLKNLLTKFNSDKNLPKHFLAIEINPDNIKSASWLVIDGKTEINRIGSLQFWDGQRKDSLLNAIDKSISEASENIEPEPDGVIFGLSESWVNNNEISEEKKQFLKFICEELNLKPLGFVLTNIAVVKYLKIKEGIPPSAILLQLASGDLYVSLVKLGQLIGTKLVGRSNDLGSDLEEGLSRFEKVDTLPSRILLFNGNTDFEEIKQQLTSYDWEKKLPFIHIPKVEVLEKDISIKAVALSGGSEVAESLGFEIKKQEQKTTKSIGFLVNKDIAEKQKLTEKSKSNKESSLIEKPKPKIKTFLSLKLSLFFQFIKSKKALFKTPNFFQSHLSLGIAIFSILLIAIFISWWILPKSDIAIFVQPQILNKNLEFKIDKNSEALDIKNNILPAKTIQISVQDSQNIETTGTTLIGEPAKGEIKIYNKTNAVKVFSANTVLIGPNSLSFTLDQDTTIASQSSQEDVDEQGDDIVILTPGVSKATITAKSIGPEGNLSKGVSLSFKNYTSSQYSTKVIAELQGGSAREVRAVSQSDKDALLKSIIQTLNIKAQENLENQLGENMILVDIADKERLISKTFNHDVDEQTDNLQLDAKLEYDALSYSKKDLDILLSESIKQEIPNDFQLSQTSETDIQTAQSEENQQTILNVNFKAKLIPKFNFDEIKRKLKGKSISFVKNYLSTLSNFIKADIVIRPTLPGKLNRIPHLSKNIYLNIEPIE